MDKLPVDWTSQPAWLILLVFFCSGVVVPIALALIGRRRARHNDDAPRPAPRPDPVEIASPWFLQNFLQMQQDLSRAAGRLDELVKQGATADQVAGLASQVASLAKLLRQRQSKKGKI